MIWLSEVGLKNIDF